MNKWTVLVVCSVLLLGAAGFYFFNQKKSDEIVGIEKNWWTDPNSEEAKWIQESYQVKPDKDGKITPPPVTFEMHDHYEDLQRLKTDFGRKSSKYAKQLVEYQQQLRTAEPQDVPEIQAKIEKRIRRLKEMKEDEEFIRLLNGN